MNEMDATSVAMMDIESDLARLENITSPDDARIRMENRLYFRIHRLECPEAFEAAKRVLNTSISARPNLSLVISDRFSRVMRAACPLMSFEDARALLNWIAGSPKLGPGYIQQMLQVFPDSGTVEAIGEIEALSEDMNLHMDNRDKRLLGELVPTLPQPKQRFVQGLILEARWAQAEGDGDRARSRQLTARKLAERLLRNQLRVQKLMGASS